ncbi:MAG: hypothetical protein H5T96_09750, partial [Tissierellales bacterium]|nr:hypothetical protein [Tissierellales bacterium]
MRKTTMQPFVEFILPTHDRLDLLRCTIASIKAQNVINWLCTIVIDNDPVDRNYKISGLVESFNDNRIKYIFTDRRWNDWGHTPREIGKQQSSA